MKRSAPQRGGKKTPYSPWLWDAALAHALCKRLCESRGRDFTNRFRLPPQPPTLSGSSTFSRE